MQQSCALIAILLLLGSGAARAELPIENAQLQKDILFAKELQKRVTCDTSEGAESPTCTFNYLGTKIEIVDSVNSTLPNIFIQSVGKGQSVLPRGARCVEILFENKSLRAPGYLLSVGILIHSTAKVWPSLDRELRSKCETE